jgi:sugar (pentulose or hexulose) kinase
MTKKMKTTECIFTIDAGTQSIRAALIDLKGNILEILKTEINPYFSNHPGWAEQEPEYYWKTLKTTCKKLLSTSQYSKESIKGVTLTTQRGSVINLDKNGKPLRPAILWLDQRKAEKEKWPPFHIKAALKTVGMFEPAIQSYRDCEANWIRQNQPEIWEQTHKYLFISGFFTYMLTGEYRDSIGGMVGYVPFDYKTQNYPKPGDLKWNLFPMSRDILPDVVSPGQELGRISKEAARATGLPAGLPVIAAAADKACEVLGSGCSTPEVGCLSYGTTATIETTTDRSVEVIPHYPPYPSAIPGKYNTEVMIFRGYWMVSWFKQEFGHREQLLAKKRNISPEKIFDEMVNEIPPGSMGLVLQPYWSPGVKVPGPEAKGSIIGFGDVHTRAHIYRAILEGLAYALKEGKISTEKVNKVKIEKLRVSGGGSQSREAMQLTADIFGIPAERPHTFETSAVGAAMDAAVGLGLHSSFDSAVNAMTSVKDVFEPIPENQKIYEALFENVYKKLYKRLKPLYDDIRDATGYPEKVV